MFEVNDILEGQKGDQAGGPKMAKIQHGVKPDIFEIALFCSRLASRGLLRKCRDRCEQRNGCACFLTMYTCSVCQIGWRRCMSCSQTHF